MLNVLTIDVEDWRRIVSRKITGEEIPPNPRVVEETKLLLDLLLAHKVHATFFVLADVAETFPELVRLIDAAGHEVASHGLSHSRILDQSPAQFREETRRAKHILESVIGKPVSGYRAAEFSITKQSWWALDVLVEEGFAYDSSIYPIAGKRYGVPESPLGPHTIQTENGSTIFEIPLTAVELWGRRWPAAGGGYFGIFPYWLTRRAIHKVNNRGRPAVVYVHPYEFANRRLQVPIPRASLRSYAVHLRHSMIHNYARRRVPGRFEQLLQDFRFAPASEVIQHVPAG